MLVIPKKDFPKGMNPLGLKRGDIVEIEIGDATIDYITLDPTSMRLKAMRDPMESREPLMKIPKPKTDMANMPLPDLKAALQNPPTPPVAPAVQPPVMPPLQ